MGMSIYFMRWSGYGGECPRFCKGAVCADGTDLFPARCVRADSGYSGEEQTNDPAGAARGDLLPGADGGCIFCKCDRSCRLQPGWQFPVRPAESGIGTYVLLPVLDPEPVLLGMFAQRKL